MTDQVKLRCHGQMNKLLSPSIVHYKSDFVWTDRLNPLNAPWQRPDITCNKIWNQLINHNVVRKTAQMKQLYRRQTTAVTNVINTVNEIMDNKAISKRFCQRVLRWFLKFNLIFNYRGYFSNLGFWYYEKSLLPIGFNENDCKMTPTEYLENTQKGVCLCYCIYSPG